MNVSRIDPTMRARKELGRTQKIEMVIHQTYGFAFTEDNPNFMNVPEYNSVFVRSSIQFLNQELQARGYVFLNEVLGTLGFELIPAGQVTGWHLEDTDRIDISCEVVDLEDGTGQTRLWVEIMPGGVIVNRI